MDKSLSKNYTFNVDDYNELLNEILENNVQSVINRCQKELYQIKNVNAGNNLIIKNIMDNRIYLHPDKKNIIKLTSIELTRKYKCIIDAEFTKSIQIYTKTQVKLSGNSIGNLLGDNIFKIISSIKISKFSLKVSLLKNTFCFLKYPKISITNIKVEGHDSNISLLISNAINMLLNDNMSEKISQIITNEIKRKLKSI